MSQINESAIKTPGVYVNEIPSFPPSIAQVATAVPIFIGYTPKAVQNGKPVFNTAVRISSLVEFTTYFGSGFDDLQANVILSTTNNSVSSVYFSNQSATVPVGASNQHAYQLFNAMQLFFNHGGSNCYVVALPVVSGASPQLIDFMPTASGTKTCFDIIQKEDEPTLIIIPDAVLLDVNGFNSLMNASLNLCGLLQDRFTIMDVHNGDIDRDLTDTDVITVFRNGISGSYLNYGAAYYPWLRTSLPYKPMLPSSFAYQDIVLQQPAGTTVTGSAILGSAVAIQIEKADTDRTTITSSFINNPDFTVAAFIPLVTSALFPPASPLINPISKSAIGTGFGLMPQSPQIEPDTEFQNKLIYITNLITGFVTLPAFTDNQPTDISTQGIFNKYTKPGVVAVPAIYTPIELLMRELILLNESAPADLDGPITTINTAAAANFGSSNTYQLTITPSPVPGDIAIYGDLTGVPAPAIAAFEMSFVRQRILKLYSNVVNYINSFYSDEAARINGLELQLAATSVVYANIKTAIANHGVVAAPSGAVAGVYAAVDGSRGVWKAPANVSLNTVIEPIVNIDDNMQGDLNIDTIGGKSVNAIRAFTGKGILVWGARTLDGNSNDFRYISVRRFYIMVEESVKKAAMQFVFEPNDGNTWVRVRAMIENYLTNLWRLGALAGSKPEQAFYVKVGLGQTMTFDDILNGKMIVEIGMAPVRPAEFIILRFSQIQQQA
ncbi:MAG: phage tail sheath C-terminal domain-containing protein [Ginsengibacter sp.]